LSDAMPRKEKGLISEDDQVSDMEISNRTYSPKKSIKKTLESIGRYH